MQSEWHGFAPRKLCDDSGGFQRARGENAGEQRHREALGAIDPKAKMGMAFTCTLCETRVTRFFSRLSYERGVVIIKLEKEDGCTVDCPQMTREMS